MSTVHCFFRKALAVGLTSGFVAFLGGPISSAHAEVVFDQISFDAGPLVGRCNNLRIHLRNTGPSEVEVGPIVIEFTKINPVNNAARRRATLGRRSIPGNSARERRWNNADFLVPGEYIISISTEQNPPVNGSQNVSVEEYCPGSEPPPPTPEPTRTPIPKLPEHEREQTPAERHQDRITPTQRIPGPKSREREREQTPAEQYQDRITPTQPLPGSSTTIK